MVRKYMKFLAISLMHIVDILLVTYLYLTVSYASYIGSDTIVQKIQSLCACIKICIVLMLI